MAAEDSVFPHGDPSANAAEALSDAELIAATRAGDASSFAVLYTRHVDAARACARRLVRSRSEADDLVAEGFAKVLGALRKGKGPDLAFRPYLLTAVRNSLYDRTRRDSRVEFTDEPPEPVNAVLLAADYEREDRAMVAQAYAALPERWQLVLWHTDVEGRQPAEVAPLLGISANSVAALAYRAREGLRQAYLHAHVNRGVSDTCKGTTEKLSAYVRDGLSARDRRAVQEHLDQCAACTALLVELQEANRSLKIVLIPVLAGVSASAYLGGLSGGGITHVVRRNPGPTAAGAVAAAAAIVFGVVALASPGGGEAAQALTAPPPGSGRPTTTTTTTTTTMPPTTSAPRTTTPLPTTVPFTPPTFDTAVPPITNVPFNPNATTATTVRRTTTTTRAPTTTTRPPTTTTATTTTQPGQVATTTTTTTSTTQPPNTAPPAPPALLSTVSGLGPAYAGQSAYFSLRVANSASGNGGSARKVAVGPADGVVVTFNLPAGAQFIGASDPGWQCDVLGANVRCLLPRIEAGAAAEAVITLDVPAGATTGDPFTISPQVTANGVRVETPSIQRTVADGSAIADYTVVRGGAVVATGNTVSTCVPGVSPADQCAQPRTAMNLPNSAYLNSSSVTVDLGSRPVQQAYLLWQGQGDPAAPITLVTPDGTTRAVTKSLSKVAGASYAAMADITDVVRAAPPGPGTYTVANVPSGSGTDEYGGWAIVAIVDDGSGALRGLTLALPVSAVPVGADVSKVPAVPVPVSGLTPVASGRNVTVALLAGEGDRTGPADLTSGEHLALNGQTLSTPSHPDGNVFRSSVAGLPGDPNTYGTDVDVFTLPELLPGESGELTLQAARDGDGVTLSAVALLFDL